MIVLLGAALAAAPPAIPDRPPDHTWTADLSAGNVLDNAWASQSSVACFAAQQYKLFSGKQQWFAVDQKAGTDEIVRVTPAAGVDVNLWALQLGPVDHGRRPPQISSAWRCTTAWLAPAGKPEIFKLGAGNSALELVIGVAGAEGAASGSFTVDVWDVSGRAFTPEP
jgi:hypothetical protein